MKHLETKREAADRRRVALMNTGLARFLERTTQETEMDPGEMHLSQASDIASSRGTEVDSGEMPPSQSSYVASSQDSASTLAETAMTTPDTEEDTRIEKTMPVVKGASETVLDKIKMTLDHAAIILRESLELNTGGVVFLDTAVGNNDAGVANAYFDVNANAGDVVEKTARSPSKTACALITHGYSQ